MKVQTRSGLSRLQWLALAVSMASSLAAAVEAEAPAAGAAAAKPAAAEAPAPKPAADATSALAAAPAATNAPQLISLTLDDVPLAEVVRLFTRISGANIIAATTNLTGQVTANLQDVQWRPAFESILERQGLLLVEKPPASGIFVIDSRKTGEDPRQSATIKLNYAKVADVNTLVMSVLQKDGTVTPFPSGNAIVVNASAMKIAEVQKIIDALDCPRTQVSIETKIVQLTEGSSKNLGIDWQGLNNYKIGMSGGQAGGALGSYTRTTSGGPTRSTTTTRSYDQYGNEVPILDHYENITTPSGTISVPIYKATTTTTAGDSSQVSVQRGLSAVLTPAQFNVVLSMLEGSTGTKLVSNPKIIVANEEKALIKMAQDEPNIKLTDNRATVQGQSDQITSALDGTTPYFTYGITVEVTPRINTSSNITVTIKPELSTKISEKTAPDGNTFPIIEKKTVETVFSLADGRTAAIGGMIETDDSDTRSKVPLLGDIPYLGDWLFSYNSRVKDQKEVLIFVTVCLVDPQTTTSEMHLPSETALYTGNYKNDAVLYMQKDRAATNSAEHAATKTP